MDLYRIIDEENNIIHEGTEEEMGTAYRIMAWDEKSLKHMYQDCRLAELKQKYPKQGKISMIKI